MAEVEYSEEAQRRKDQLTYFILNELNGVTVLEQKIECAGKVCAIELLIPSSGNDQSLNKLSQFSSNYAFEQFTETEAGDKKLKALYIATADPSQLTLAD